MSKEFKVGMVKLFFGLILVIIFTWLSLALSIWGFRQPWSMASPMISSAYVLSALLGAIGTFAMAIFGTVVSFAWAFDR